ncbi:hypothetical protein [Undibacterium sp. TJN19]|uniref:hypothetical protein n=1 Tax=Undibacterium sp. TJN19 TaxID=3413055 RepID=UPI003BF39DD9
MLSPNNTQPRCAGRSKLAQRALPVRLALLAGMVALQVLPPIAQATPLTMRLAALDRAEKATVVMVPTMWAFYARLDEKALKKVGCTFVTTDRTHIAALKTLLEQANPDTLDSPVRALDIRNAVFFNLPGGMQSKFVFSMAYGNKDALDGIYHAVGSGTGVPVKADRALIEQLSIWTTRPGVEQVASEVTKSACADLRSKQAHTSVAGTHASTGLK